ncbi:hypothetical protein [Agromyces binzhouensis]|uniref:Uncharacterized protein n=1 Tax=Agromyces binzhouensis TaxID=1817495 RepID=A0A4Q2JZZ8_9MICO|nr:hypothetical protein [Agromyces binzhouensis]RXZ51868.1 hypothetical protein ESO86_00520 [Agromyces binzhouensis]
MANFFGRRREALWRVEQYRGQRSVEVQATQLEGNGVTKRSEQKRIDLATTIAEPWQGAARVDKDQP